MKVTAHYRTKAFNPFTPSIAAFSQQFRQADADVPQDMPKEQILQFAVEKAGMLYNLTRIEFDGQVVWDDKTGWKP